MSRILTLCLLLIVVFLVGTMFGMDRQASGSFADQRVEDEPQDVVVHRVRTTIPNNEIINTPKENVNEQIGAEPQEDDNNKHSKHLTEQVASFIETGVKGFYEAVVDFLYHFSSLFI